jgi:GH25 family lysozyme M1 (1,4-beta-N-acetylmuramidase)
MIVDTSRYQQQYRFDVQPIDYERARVEGGVSHAIPRAIQGIHEADPFYPASFVGWKRAGVDVGAYGVLYPAQHPRQQAKTFAQFLRALGFDVRVDGPIGADFELRQGVALRLLPDISRAYLEELEDQMQVIPEVYTGPWWWNPNIGWQSWAKRHPLWVADHRLVARPELPLGWTEWERWQFKSEGSVPGITGNVDLSRPRVYFPPEDGVYRVEIVATWLRIRSGAGIAYAISGGLAQGEIVEVYDELGDWLRISPDAAPPAWIHAAWAVRVDEP